MFDKPSVMQKAVHLVDATFADEMSEYVHRANKKLKALHQASEDNSGKKIRHAQQIVMRSHSVKLCCLVLSLRLKDYPFLTSALLHEVANEVDPWSDCEEPVQAYPKAKSVGLNWRPICKFGPVRQTLQTIIDHLLEAKYGCDPVDYMARGRGAEIAADRICELIDGGTNYFVVADIASCFGSVKQEEVHRRLGLPPAVALSCLMIGKDVPLQLPSTLPTDTSYEAFSETVRRGIPQGARSSSRIAALLLGPKLRSLTSDQRIVLYGDDFAIPAATRLEAEAFAKILPDLFWSDPAGPFRLKCCEVQDARKGFNFLKYKFRRDNVTGKSRLQPSTLSYHRFGERVKDILSENPVTQAYEEVMTYRHRWMQSFRRYSFTEIAKEYLGMTAINELPPPLLDKWRVSCAHFKMAHIFPPGSDIDWDVK